MRDPGPTFRPDQLGWIDFETKADVDIDVGTYRYLSRADPLVLAVAIGEGPAMAFPFPLLWNDLPPEIHAHQAAVARGEAVWAAWNASFDREVWNQLTDYPELDPHHVIDVMAQAVSAGLPGKLADAARLAHVPVQKRKIGKDLIRLFTLPSSAATPATHPEEWQEFLRYAADDIDAMRGVFRSTLQLPIEDWQEYWANERINLNGIAFDRRLAERAEAMAKKDKSISAGELHRLTGGAVGKVTEVKRMIDWLKTALQPADQSYLVRQLEEVAEDTGEVTKKERLSLDRRRIQLLAALLDAKENPTPGEIAARRLLDIRQYGGSTTPAKFSRMLETHVDGLLLGQFVFNGAPQTGRFSSRIVQLHNLMRDALPYEMDAIDSLLNGATPASFATLGDNTAISRKLSMLIRPTLIPEDTTNGAFVWGDWSQIEARITPWLAGVEKRLDIFREVDADPSKPDLYTVTAATISGVPVEEVTKAMRQRGKVMELACFAADTRVLTDSGIKPIINVQLTDKLWDGVEWISHHGVLAKGQQATVSLDGVCLTPRHLIAIDDSWWPAKQIVSSESLLCQALATGSASLPSSLTNTDLREVSPTALHSAPAELRHIGSLRPIFAMVARRCASVAQQNNYTTGAKISLVTPISFLMPRIVGGFSTVSRLALFVVRQLKETLRINTMLTTEGAAFAFFRSGLATPEVATETLKANGSFLPIWLRFRAGITTSWKWTESILTEITSRAISDLLPRVQASNALSGSCKNASTNSKPVYDIAHAGPRNRFTIISNSGALIVHNCGFCGGKGALQGMAANYGMFLDDDEAQALVNDWREANPWAQDYSRKLWEAMRHAMEAAGQVFEVGPIGFIYLKEYLGGTVLMRLPSGRFLTYRAIRWETVDELDDNGVIIDSKWELTFARQYGRMKLWPGVLVENSTQACAACVLRGSLVRAEQLQGFPRVRAHVHDEMLVETSVDRAEHVAIDLVALMEAGFAWSEGLPLKAEAAIAFSYTKNPESQWS